MVAATVSRPPANALDAEVGIVHLGLGAFHRANQAILTQQALAAAPGPWAISGASLRGAAVRDAMRPQDCLYTLMEGDGTDEQATIVGTVHEALFAPDEAELLLARLAAPSTRIVSLTVTEKGYGHNPATGELDLANPEIREDLTTANTPRSTIGWLVRGLIRRRAAHAGGVTVLCCDNMQSNGRTLRHLVRQFAEEASPDLLPWIDDAVRFPSSMVDRIVPAATPAMLDRAAGLLGLRDEAAVSAESFMQWVIEDDFAVGRPRWEAAGVELVRDVRPYQELKLRLLNGAHSAIAYGGVMLGKPFVADVMADPVLARFVERLMLDEIAPLTPAPSGFDVERYVRALLQRFANRGLQHRTLQIAMDGSQKIPVRWLPVLREARRRDFPVPRLIAAVALWLRFLVGRDEAGRELPLDDPLAARLREVVVPVANDPGALVRAALGLEEVFGPDLRQDAVLFRQLGDAVASMAQDGVYAVLSN